MVGGITTLNACGRIIILTICARVNPIERAASTCPFDIEEIPARTFSAINADV